MGFDALIPANAPARPEALAGCLRLSDLVATQEGRDFCKAHGVEVPSLSFALADGSLSWQTFNAYLEPAAEPATEGLAHLKEEGG